MRTLLILLFGLTIFSCNQTQTAQDKIITQNTIVQTQLVKDTLISNIERLFKKALTCDTVEYSNEFEFEKYKSFLFFKSGYILSKTEKNALVVTCPTDSTYTVILYSLQTDQWKLSDSISELDAFPTQFDPIFDDYNFDGQTDLYIQVSASNGWSLSRGHLIIIDPMTKKFDLHKEARDFANMTIDKKSKTIKAELWDGYDLKGRHQLTIFTNKWVNGQLTTTSKKNITIEPNK
ncbi:hypothetical protein CHU92_02780 [Flavobacterium cyanobacteriorum]|uniref:Uncharacterized protein n=1 Tax=Flavobacterium cyanobacteriorum TaxID=2022802 RepID=A0A255ZQT9_9FLAO|nr:hypothetical protein [Flavobacterium cyanobacteriorum]OYQ43927.1 hypothetical protein CHU92_02780 [Flavobacterium cyanobacteriorum]